ncbi:MAG: PASTA domain-containing protein [Deltaproteobacteria bacterium]|nr:PASTA domain-containing protein [Deltaproteobacteria bacterium]
MKRLFRFLVFAAVFAAAAAAAGFGVMHVLFATADTVVVPDLVGKDVVWTLEVLTGLGLNTKVTDLRHDARVGKNKVISQDPPPGSEVKKNRDVRIVLSAGPAEVVLPDLSHLSLAAARIALEEVDLAPGRVCRVHAPAPEGTVLAHDPAAGSRVAWDTSVDLLVSAGPEKAQFAVPDLSGMDAERAVAVAEEAGLSVEFAEPAADPSIPKNTVIDQDPGFGYRVRAGEALSIRVNRPGGPEVPGGEDPRRFLLLRTPPGYLKTRLVVRTGLFGSRADLLDQAVKPDTRVWILVPPGAEGGLRVKADGKPVDLREHWAGRAIRKHLEKYLPEGGSSASLP